MSDKTTFFFPDTQRLADKIRKEREEKSKEQKQFNRDDVCQILAKQMKAFAIHNNIDEDTAQKLLARAESSIATQENKETDFFKFNDIVFKVAQDMLDHKDDHVDGAHTPPSSPIEGSRRKSS